MRLYPWPVVTMLGEVEREELRKVAQARWANPWAAWGFDAADWGGEATSTLAVLEGDALEHVEHALGRRMGWQRTGVGLREAVGRTLS